MNQLSPSAAEWDTARDTERAGILSHQTNTMNTDTIEKTHRLSGGENPITPEEQHLRRLIEAEPDVHRLHALTQLESGSYAYLIQTPFATFPKFAVGITDPGNSDPSVLLQCSAQWSAENFFDNLVNQ